MKSVVVSIRIPKEIKDTFEKHNINIAKILKEEVKKYYKVLKRKELKKLVLTEIELSLKNEKERKRISPRLIREDRER